MKSALVGIVKNEGHCIFEWVLYHALQGFDAVILYDNNSTDHTRTETAKAARFADVRVRDWPMHPGQVQAYDHALSTHAGEFDVFVMLDADEFLVPMQHSDIRSFLGSTEGLSHVAVRWEVYGSSGHQTRPAGLVTESYTWRAKHRNKHIKTICRPALFREPGRWFNPHVVTGGDYTFADGSQITWPAKPGKVPTLGPDIARINHYWCKSREDFDAKMAKGVATGTWVRNNRFEDEDRNDVHDPVVVERFSHILDRIKDAAVTAS